MSQDVAVQPDYTRIQMPIEKNQLRRLISETLSEVGLHSESAVELLMLTAAVESNLGDYIDQSPGVAVGIFQMEPITHDDLYATWIKYRPNGFQAIVYAFIDKYVGIDKGAYVMRHNLKYAILMARLKYLRVSEPLPPNDVQLLAEYYKKYYNTPLGKGTVKKAIEKYKRYCV